MDFPLGELFRRFGSSPNKKELVMANLIVFVVFSFFLIPIYIFLLVIFSPIIVFFKLVPESILPLILLYVVLYWLGFLVVKIRDLNNSLKQAEIEAISIQQIVDASYSDEFKTRKAATKSIRYRKERSSLLINILKRLEEDDHYSVRETAKKSLKIINQRPITVNFDNKLHIEFEQVLNVYRDFIKEDQIRVILQNSSTITDLNLGLDLIYNNKSLAIDTENDLETFPLQRKSKRVFLLNEINSRSDLLSITTSFIEPLSGKQLETLNDQPYLLLISITNNMKNAVNITKITITSHNPVNLLSQIVPKGKINRNNNDLIIENILLDGEENIVYNLNLQSKVEKSDLPIVTLNGSSQSLLEELSWEITNLDIDLQSNIILTIEKENTYLNIDVYNNSDFIIKLLSTEIEVYDGAELKSTISIDHSNIIIHPFATIAIKEVHNESYEELMTNIEFTYQILTQEKKSLEFFYHID